MLRLPELNEPGGAHSTSLLVHIRYDFVSRAEKPSIHPPSPTVLKVSVSFLLLCLAHACTQLQKHASTRNTARDKPPQETFHPILPPPPSADFHQGLPERLRRQEGHPRINRPGGAERLPHSHQRRPAPEAQRPPRGDGPHSRRGFPLIPAIRAVSPPATPAEIFVFRVLFFFPGPRGSSSSRGCAVFPRHGLFEQR